MRGEGLAVVEKPKLKSGIPTQRNGSSVNSFLYACARTLAFCVLGGGGSISLITATLLYVSHHFHLPIAHKRLGAVCSSQL